MTLVGIEPAILASDWTQNHSLYGAATGIGRQNVDNLFNLLHTNECTVIL
jgi:hypothetical protein